MNVEINGPKILGYLFGNTNLPITETMRNSWIIMAFILFLCIFLTHRMQKIPKGKQALAEKAVLMIDSLVESTMGEGCQAFSPYIMTLMMSSLFGSLASLFWMRSTTADLNTTLGWALITFVLITFNKIKYGGIKGYLKGFLEPIFVMAPLNVLSEIATPVSMSFRHFVLGAVAIFFYVGVEVGIPNTANLYMSNLSWVGPAIAGTMVGVYWFMMMCGRLLGGALGGKISSRAMLTSVCLLALVFVFCIMFIPETVKVNVPIVNVHVPLSMVFMFLCGICTSVMWGSIYNLAAEGLGKYTPAASGIFMALVCGGGIIPFIQNWLADMPSIGSIGSYWVIVVGILYMLFYALVGSKNVNKDIPVE